MNHKEIEDKQALYKKACLELGFIEHDSERMSIAMMKKHHGVAVIRKKIDITKLKDKS